MDNTWARITWLREKRELMFDIMRELRETGEDGCKAYQTAESNFKLFTDASHDLMRGFAQAKVNEKGYGSIDELKILSYDEIVAKGLDEKVAIALDRLFKGDDFEDTSSA